eukprot:1479787-Lingulodinium_polyedra.AAC.1
MALRVALLLAGQGAVSWSVVVVAAAGRGPVWRGVLWFLALPCGVARPVVSAAGVAGRGGAWRGGARRG